MTVERTKRHAAPAPARLDDEVDLLTDGPSFIPGVLASTSFRTRGLAYGRGGEFWWVVVDPRTHPLRVWKASNAWPGAYAGRSRSLGAAVITNGPMMGKRIGLGWKLTRSTAMAELGSWPTAALAAALLIRGGLRTRLAIAAGGVVAGACIAALRVFGNWIPCGTVRGSGDAIEDGRNFDDEGRRHVWFGRSGSDFDSYGIGDGDLPSTVVEGAGGLILLVRDYAPVSQLHGVSTADFAELSHKRGVVAWGLTPVQGRAGHDLPEGVVIILASRDADAVAATACLVRIGTRDAAATDQRAAVMLGVDGEFLVGPPPFHRQAMQTYGFCC